MPPSDPTTTEENFPWSLLPAAPTGLESPESWIHWIENGLKALAITDEPPPCLSIPTDIFSSKHSIPERDYTMVHDTFLEILLEEQRNTNNGSSSTEETQPLESRKGSKRNAKVAPLDLAPLPLTRTPSMSLNPPAESFVHENCRLQKDKGQGEEPDTAVCVEGRDDCMYKLRQKMELLAQVAPDPNSPNKKKKRADMTIVNAVTTLQTNEFTETRSMLDLRMGFLSIKYGILLRWDHQTSLVTLVVLRKMCADNFLRPTPSPGLKRRRMSPPPQQQQQAVAREKMVTPSGTYINTEDQPELGFILQTLGDGTPTILQNIIQDDSDDVEAEVALLSAPYRVQRPEEFGPARLLVSSITAKIKDHPKKWNPYLIVKFGKQIHKTQRIKCCTNNELSWDDSECQFSIFPQDHFKCVHIEVWNNRRHKRDMKIAKFQIPLTSIEPSITPESDPIEKVAPSKEGTVTLLVAHHSEYSWWLSQELDARKQERLNNWKASQERKASEPSLPVALEVEDEFALSMTDSCCVC